MNSTILSWLLKADWQEEISKITTFFFLSWSLNDIAVFFLLIFFCSPNDQTRGQCQREKKKCVSVLEIGKGGAQDATILENPSEIPSVTQGVNFRNH